MGQGARRNRKGSGKRSRLGNGIARKCGRAAAGISDIKMHYGSGNGQMQGNMRALPGKPGGRRQDMVIEINKDIDRYKESVVMGLTAKQLIFSVASVAAGLC